MTQLLKKNQLYYYIEMLRNLTNQYLLPQFQATKKSQILFIPHIQMRQKPLERRMQNEQSRDNQQPVKIDSPKEFYPGICNLCTSKQHLTIDCPFCVILYHVTNLQNLISIVKNGFNIRFGRLGKAIYCSNDPSMCVRFFLKNQQRFPNPVLIKIKAMITNTRTVSCSQEVKLISQEEFKKEKIQCIKCPYFKVGDEILYQFALFDVDYSIVGWSRIKMPQNIQNTQNVQKNIKCSISIPVACSEKKQDKMIPENNKQPTLDPMNQTAKNIQPGITRNNSQLSTKITQEEQKKEKGRKKKLIKKMGKRKKTKQKLIAYNRPITSHS